MIFKLLTRVIRFGDINYGSHIPSSGSDAVITIPAKANCRIIIHRIYWSYSAAGAGRLTISDGNASDITLDITASGPGVISMNRLSAVGNQSVVTLTGIASTQGRLHVEYTVEHG